ncbi:MAG: nickel-dependent hydrogenase large subunit [Desulfobacteraceae bacterium]|nr:nickel-dependent hydrogenase large subunit [Desulfobacteraceae bacterium]
MKAATEIRLPMNRVEGDLEIRVEVTDGHISEAYSVGTMYRGFENLLRGRAPLDGLVITPRICGICSTAHLMAAAKALDDVFGARVPGNGTRVRNVSLMVEQIQNDLRHMFLLFAVDFTRPAYAGLPLYEEAVRRHTPLRGTSSSQAIRETKRLVEIVAILGGQWPHSSFMVPGGVVSVPTANEVNQCRSLLASFRKWYEGRILGCRLERWREVDSGPALQAWLDESDAHRESDLGFFLRFSRQAGLDAIGGGHGNFLSFGGLKIPESSSVSAPDGGLHLVPSGFVSSGRKEAFDPAVITEDIGFSRFTGYTGGRHPSEGITVPDTDRAGDARRSWAKAPRYGRRPAETGPLAERIVAADPLFCDLVGDGEGSVFARQLARLVRPALLFPAVDTWLKEIASSGEGFYKTYRGVDRGDGFGAVQAHRGALGHWITIENVKIARYQVITPTAWNASPRDDEGVRGPVEQALIGLPVADPEDPIAVEHVVRSFDPCLVCTVHAIEGEGTLRPVTFF